MKYVVRAIFEIFVILLHICIRCEVTFAVDYSTLIFAISLKKWRLYEDNAHNSGHTSAN